MPSPSPLDERYGRAVRTIWGRVLGPVLAGWSDLGSYRDADALAWRRKYLPTILAGERQVASLTAAYLEQTYAEIDARAPRVELDLDDVTGRALRGVDPEEVYERPFVAMRYALSKGADVDDAIAQGKHRLETLVKTDLQLARTHTVRDVGEGLPAVEYTVRVLQGEYDCALCMIASTQRYTKRDLAPIHPGCDCLVKLVKADHDPGQVIDEERLERIHDLVEEAVGRSDRGGRAVDYRKIIIANDHGEIGPVLGFAGQRFSGPDDIRLPT